ncbi:MAG: hypothetical protein A4S14_00135 [Proteobacteria bacterium SG_bin9]|nr:MAG: hypothetical protein A4S14_00135 [Proteobacteria bacterium SG_bin9]
MATQDERRAATIAAIRASARKLFATSGFENTSIDEIAEHAGVTKGAFYHHFDSKERIFEDVLEMVQSELSGRVTEAASKAVTPVTAIELGMRQFLMDSAKRDFRQIIFIDGPAVLGWKRWREIDLQHFGGMVRQSIQALRGSSELDGRDEALVHLLLGAFTEAALICGSAKNPAASARDLVEGVQVLLRGLQTST